MRQDQHDPRIDELLDEWEELAERGEHATPEELCAEAPELLDVLQQKIEALQSVDEFLGKGVAEEEAPVREGEPITESNFTGLKFHAKGGIGEIFRARDEEFNREVALKFIQRPHDRSGAAKKRFQREAEVTGGLEHPGIVPVYGRGMTRRGTRST